MQQIFLHIAVYIARQRVYVIYEAIIYSKRSLLRLCPLPSNNELSAAKAHCIEFTIYNYYSSVLSLKITKSPVVTEKPNYTFHFTLQASEESGSCFWSCQSMCL